MSFVPSSYQQAIFEWFKTLPHNAAINAVAGSGKSTSLVHGLGFTDSSIARGALFVAFAKDIVESLKPRLPFGLDCRTLHSLGFATLRKSITPQAGKYTIDGYKYKNLTRNMQIPREYGDPKVFKDTLDDLFVKAQATLTPAEPQALLALAERFGIDEPPCGFEPMAEAVALLMAEGVEIAKKSGVISFSDQVWLPSYLQLQPPTYSLVCVDEAQDLSAAQMALVRGAANGTGKVIAVGDPRQAIYCQPAGTMIMTPEGEKTIESLKKGQTVFAFNRRDAAIYKSAKIEKVGHRLYTGDLIKVSLQHPEMPELSKQATECTDNHRWLVRWSEKSTDLNVTYLMQKGNRFRIGWCQLFSKTDDEYGGFHLGVRARIEKADNVWILGVHQTKTQASLAESEAALRFGLPTIPFQAVNGANHLTQEAIDTFFDELIFDVDLNDRAGKCLAAFGRLIEWPFYKVDWVKRGRTTLFEVRACNLISGMMKIPIYTGNRHKVDWLTAKVFRSKVQDLPVWSLEVEKHHTYIANGIVTGNSFAGAESDSFYQLSNYFGATQYPLSICYRCPSSVVDRARLIVPQIEAAPGAQAGVVDTINEEKFQKMLTDGISERRGDMVLCRTTAPLIKLCFQLIRRRVNARIKGRDISATLTNTVRQVCKMCGGSWDNFIASLDAFKEHQLYILNEKFNTEGQQDNLRDRCEAIEICFESFAPASMDGFISDIESLFSDQRAAITLSTVHRAKGLENPRVFIIKPEKLPLVWKNQTEAQAEQEMNLRYVAITRAQSELYFVKTDEEEE